MTVTVYNLHGATVRRSANLRGVLLHYAAKPDDLVIKVKREESAGRYRVTFFWPRHGDSCETTWQDWRVLLDWLAARRSWSIERVTFDAPLYDACEHDPRLASFRKNVAPLTRHAYQS